MWWIQSFPYVYIFWMDMTHIHTMDMTHRWSVLHWRITKVWIICALVLSLWFCKLVQLYFSCIGRCRHRANPQSYAYEVIVCVMRSNGFSYAGARLFHIAMSVVDWILWSLSSSSKCKTNPVVYFWFGANCRSNIMRLLNCINAYWIYRGFSLISDHTVCWNYWNVILGRIFMIHVDHVVVMVCNVT